MKKMMIAGCLILGGLAANAQDIDDAQVPAALQKAFKMKYTSATDVDWEKVGANYKAGFKIGTSEHDVVLSPKGTLVSHGEKVPNNTLPAVITSNIKKTFPKAQIDDVEKIETGKNISYKIGLDGTPDATLWYSAAGKLLKKEND